MKDLTLKNIALACHGIYRGAEDKAECEVDSITTDSRQVMAGCLFVPIKGEWADGHSFIREVMEKGALCTLSEKELPEADFPYIQVESSLKAVKDIAEFYLQRLRLPVVGITGSVGKTSTKEMIAAVLGQRFDVLKTLGNFNNELGLPLTVFRIRENHEIAVLEMGISDSGEMSRLAKVARPDTCVITNIGCCHLENLIDRDGVFRAKTEMFEYVQKNGHVVLNGDDDKLIQVKETGGIRPVFFGLHQGNEIYADCIKSRGLKGISCRIHVGKEYFDTLIPIPGEHMVYNALAGTAVGRIYGLSLDEIRAGIESLQSLSGRLHIIEANQMTVIDDCYNANPMSMKASLEILKDALGRSVAILGDMGELGENENRLHAEIGTAAAELGIDILVCVGRLSRHMAEAAREKAGKTHVIYFEKREELLDNLGKIVQEGDTVLVKASRFMQFETVVEALKK